jgi:PTS system nitrogen regulatory IIA component
MQLSVQDVSALFEIPEGQVYRWVHEDGLPSRESDGRLFFNRAEVLEWATLRRRPLSARGLREWERLAPGDETLAEALRAGGVARVPDAHSLADAVQAAVRLIPLPDEGERALLLDLVLARVAAGSIVVADGIALPHPRRPVVLAHGQSVVTVAYLDPPVAVAGHEAEPVHTLISLVCPTIRSHLAMLARITHALREPAFHAGLAARADLDSLVAELERIEAPFHPTRPQPNR